MRDCFDRLLAAVIQRRVVPFVGAGISQGAHLPPPSTWRPSVAHLTRELLKSLARYLRERSLTAPWLRNQIRTQLGLPAVVRSGTHSNDKQTPGRKPAVGRPISLDRAAEVHTWIFGAHETCEKLRIANFTRLCTRPAHRYLVRLAREGLISEIISTNYDTCIEKAFADSYPGRQPTRNTTIFAIASLADYREHGGGRSSTLRVFKINGCADRFMKEGESAEQEPDAHKRKRRRDQCGSHILLTERQLQTFQDRSWAEDLFRDRARSHALVFSGFGADEPQVRHTFLSLADEFQNQTEYQEDPARLWLRQNAPFVVSYEEHLSFSQTQLLRAFAAAHEVPYTTYGPQPAPDSNHLTGADRRILNPEFLDVSPPNRARPIELAEPPRTLPADEFWRLVYASAMRSVLQQAIEDGSPFQTWLIKSEIPREAKVRADLIDWLYPEPDNLRKKPPDAQSWFRMTIGRFPELFSEPCPESGACGSHSRTGLSNFVFALFACRLESGPDDISCRSSHFSVREEPIIVPILLLLLQLLSKNREKLPKVWIDEDDFGLVIPLENGNAQLTVISQDAPTPPPAGIGRPGRDCRASINIILADYGGRAVTHTALTSLRNSASGFKATRVIEIYAADIVPYLLRRSAGVDGTEDIDIDDILINTQMDSSPRTLAHLRSRRVTQ